MKFKTELHLVFFNLPFLRISVLNNPLMNFVRVKSQLGILKLSVTKAIAACLVERCGQRTGHSSDHWESALVLVKTKTSKLLVIQ